MTILNLLTQKKRNSSLFQIIKCRLFQILNSREMFLSVERIVEKQNLVTEEDIKIIEVNGKCTFSFTHLWNPKVQKTSFNNRVYIICFILYLLWLSFWFRGFISQYLLCYDHVSYNWNHRFIPYYLYLEQFQEKVLDAVYFNSLFDFLFWVLILTLTKWMQGSRKNVLWEICLGGIFKSHKAFYYYVKWDFDCIFIWNLSIFI